jgi:DNA polymerase (family 10)
MPDVLQCPATGGTAAGGGMKQHEIASLFNQMADLLEFRGENPFRIRAYRKAAQNLESLTEDVERVSQHNRMTDIPGIG